MSTFLYYGGSGILAYPTGQPIPLYSENESFVRFGERWHALKSYSLNGQLTGCNYQSILTVKTKLEQIYSKDFQPFQIVENNAYLINNKFNIIKGINFSASRYVGILDYTINIDCYPQNLFSGVYGVIDPVDSWEWNENDDKTIELSHVISARGFNTSNSLNNAFENAKDFVISRTGTSNYIAPYFISYCTGANLCLFDGPTENADRFNNTYSITEKYKIDSFNNSNIRYSTEYNCDINNGLATLNINGEIKSCRGSSLDFLRNKYQSFDIISAAAKAYSEACGRNDLNPNFISSGITENPFSKSVSFQVNFDNDWQPKTRFEYETSIRIGEDDINNVSIQGVIKSRGDLNTRWAEVESFYNHLNLFNLANQSYLNFYNNFPIYPLNNIQQSYSVTKNKFLGEISVSTDYNNKDIIPIEFKDLDYTLLFVPQINKIVSQPLVNLGSGPCSGMYYVSNLGYTNRANFGIRGSVIGSCTGNSNSVLQGMYNFANNKLLTHAPVTKIILEKDEVTSSNNGIGLDYDFFFQWSMEANQNAIVNPFSFVDNLSLK